MEMLRVSKAEIVNSKGQPVRLRGTCLGGWMNMEGFINGFPGVECSLRAAMAEVLGTGKAEFFFERWQDHFLSESDIAFIKACGANVVRIPLNYRRFEYDGEPFKYLGTGFERLNRAIQWCRKYGLYVILDLHAAPGWQNPDWHSDNPTQTALLWAHPHFQERFIAVWQEIARRYRGEAVIAGYDLMNEPLSNAASERSNGSYRPDWGSLNRLYRRAVRAIREVDTEHIIFLEGDGFSTRFLGMDEPFAENLAYSSHHYNRAGWGPGAYPGLHREGFWDREMLVQAFQDHEGRQYTRQYNVPLWAGEFGSVFNGPPEDRPSRLRGIEDQISVFEQFGVHWTTWTYKDLGVMGWVGLDPDSEYMLRAAPVLKAKLQLHSDSWMYWLPSTPAKELLSELACVVQQTMGEPGPDGKWVQGQLIKAALGGYASSQMQPAYARLFKDMSEVEIDRVLESFAFENCRPNQDLVGVVKKYMHGVEADLTPGRAETARHPPSLEGKGEK